MNMIHIEFVDFFDYMIDFAGSAKIVDELIFGELNSPGYR